MDKALRKASLAEDTVVYRGITGYGMTWEKAQKLVGTTEYDPAFASTTLSPAFASYWASGSSISKGTADNPFISYRISMPKGAQAAYIHGATGSMQHEYELTINKGARYNITGVQQQIVGGKHYIFVNAKYLGQGGKGVKSK